MRTVVAVMLASALGPALAGCGGAPGPASPTGDAQRVEGDCGRSTSIAVSSTYFASAVRDVMGEEIGLLVLAEPGMCPGHFDLRPSQVRQLRSCALTVRFDFQQGLDSRLGGLADLPPVVAVRVPGGMCEPESYVAACREVAEALICAGLVSRETAEGQLTDVARRMDRLSDWAGTQLRLAGLEGAPVLSSGHQAAFCRRLGLKVAGTFSAADTATPGQIDAAVKQGVDAGVRFVIANLPEGRQLADALAGRLGAKVAVFGNFPAAGEAQAFDALFRHNVGSLLEVARDP